MRVIPEVCNPLDNKLLAALPPEDYDRLLPHLETVELGMRESIYEPYQPMRYVYFPSIGVASLLTVMKNGKAAEVGLVGNEGMAGLPLFLGADISTGQAFWQVPGQAARMNAEVFKEATQQSEALRTLLLRYTQALFTQVAQSAACNRLHSTEQRLSRWLLMTYDRVQLEEFPIKQDFLAAMLAVRRASITEAAGALQAQGLIHQGRGKIAIVDVKGLEQAACECYQVIKEEYARLLG
ncbi:MAG: transcriptional regulator, Crp/Fnr family [Chthonomonadales bacterium]|nr:transcriptional regulator, Crp/Fnr family [Chthonomonadales bacterium]